MGCGGSKSGGVAKPQRHPDDNELDACEAEETKLPKVDELFGDALPPFQSCVEINNSLVMARDKIMEAVLKVAGATRVRLEAQADKPAAPFVIVYFTGEEEKDMSPAEVAAMLKKNESLKLKNDELVKTIAAFGKIVGKIKDAKWSVHERQCTRVLCEQDKKSALALSISAANVKFELVRLLAKDSMNPKNNIIACFKELSNVLKEEAKNIALDMDMEKLMDGELKIELKFGEKSLADVKTLLPPKWQAVLDAIAGEEEGNEGLIFQLKKCVVELGGLKEKLETAAKALEGAKDINVKDEAQAAGLSPMQVPAAGKAFKANLENAARAPAILQQTKDTLSALVNDLKNAIIEALAAAGGAPKIADAAANTEETSVVV